MKAATAPYKTALRWKGLTPFYDRVMALTMRENYFRSLLLEPIRDRKPRYVLDVGCGTGTLALLLHRQFPDASVFGLDGDEKALAIARQKHAVAGWPIVLEQGLSTALPYPDGSMDLVTCSLLLHHLSDADKQQSIREMHRVLSPGGMLMLADWGKPANKLMRLLSYGLQLFDGFDTTAANIQGRIPNMLYQGGFKDITQTGQVNTLFGTLALYRTDK
ncbi:Menaquinone biosynthesis methyltransferase ubiE (plasmid) [Fibrisoma limi BUZ 3]|uniref:Menaquinone biosynthesis methyltransferase ubiE n=1 Tax=Fibrisoma limi BUZ 3 TaxID=1185876 RepID=I2GU69_9BACT|nr:class I SAM-dependent methyltransferase [Fibrisoma limi]CCH57670.1 Menaquinone biosynthesis methyltransferase ubiE [Fibrisoma limi BUZ 3]